MAIGLIPYNYRPYYYSYLIGLIAIIIGEVARTETGVITVMTLGATAHGTEADAGMEEEVGMAAGLVHDPTVRSREDSREEDVVAAVQVDANA